MISGQEILLNVRSKDVQSQSLMLPEILYPWKLNVALSIMRCSYVVLLVDLSDETIYYLPIQEFFIANPSYFSKLSSTQENITIRIPTDNKVTNEDENLQEIAKSRYVGGPGEGLHKAE